MEQWSTTAIPAVRRAPYWIEAVNQAYVQLECAVPHRSSDPFFGAITRRELAEVNLSHITSTAQTVLRTPQQISKASEDVFLLSIQLAGAGQLVQDQKIARLKPGELALYDSTRPYELLFDHHFEQYVLSLPGSLLRKRLRNAEDMTACKITTAQSGTARLLSRMITELMDSPPAGGPVVDMAVADGLVSILVATLAENMGSLSLKDESVSLRCDRIKAYVLENLRDPDLSISKIAKRLNLTASTVHRAWEGEPDTLSKWMWSMRLKGAEQDLHRLACSDKTITEIAYHWGFSSSAHFSRAFRQHFGVPPKEARAGRRALLQSDLRPS